MPYYIGVLPYTSKRELFQSRQEPTAKTCGGRYACAIGPFKTKRGAEFMLANPMCQHVDDAERLSREFVLWGVHQTHSPFPMKLNSGTRRECEAASKTRAADGWIGLRVVQAKQGYSLASV